MKQKIRLTEGDLHRIIRNCVNEALNELDARTYASYADKHKVKTTKQNKADKLLLMYGIEITHKAMKWMGFII